MTRTATEVIEGGVTPRQYAEANGIALQTAYTHIWTGKVEAQKVLDRGS